MNKLFPHLLVLRKDFISDGAGDGDGADGHLALALLHDLGLGRSGRAKKAVRTLMQDSTFRVRTVIVELRGGIA